MKTETMSINRGLRKLKTLDSRINRLIRDGVFVVSAKNAATKINGKTKEELKTSMKADNNSVVDLINYRDAIKAAIIASNAVTTVEIANGTFSVACAINKKDAIIAERNLLNAMKNQYASAKHLTEHENDKLEKKFETYITGMYGGKDKIDAKELEASRVQYYKVNGYELIDSLNIEKLINEKQLFIEDFMDDIDSILTDSNSITNITIEW